MWSTRSFTCLRTCATAGFGVSVAFAPGNTLTPLYINTFTLTPLYSHPLTLTTLYIHPPVHSQPRLGLTHILTPLQSPPYINSLAFTPLSWGTRTRTNPYIHSYSPISLTPVLALFPCPLLVPGSRYVLTGTKDGHLQVADTASGDLVVDLATAHSGAIWSICVRPDGR